VHRWDSYGTQFGYHDRQCFILVDYGQSANEEDVPVVRYKWKGGSLLVVFTPAVALFPAIRSRLREHIEPQFWSKFESLSKSRNNDNSS
jgi:hypothetical protein